MFLQGKTGRTSWASINLCDTKLDLGREGKEKLIIITNKPK